MADDTGTDIAIPDNLPAVEREIEDVQVLMRDRYEYARSPSTQAPCSCRVVGVALTPTIPSTRSRLPVPGS